MIILYNLLLIFPFIFSIPITYLILGKEEFLKRYGFILPNVRNPIWIHCASLGELNAIKPLINKIKKVYPDENILITTTSRTGYEEAKKITDFVTFLPVDFYPIIKRFIKELNPSLLIITETEIWPNLFYLAKNIVIVNGRISDKTFKIYRILSFFFKPIFKNIKFVCAQSEDDKYRYLLLGFKNVENFGNLKFAVELPDINKTLLRKKLSFSADDFIITWGSSRPNEEILFYNIYKELLKEIPNLKIIVAPRHLKRLEEVKNYFPDFRLFSKKTNDSNIMIVDKMGVLTSLYAISNIAIIGGSFYNFQGHNPLEAVYYKVPVIIGNFHSSCRDSVNILKNSSAIIVSDKDNLKKDIINLYKNKEKRIKLGENGFECMKKNSRSLIKTLDCIKKILGNRL